MRINVNLASQKYQHARDFYLGWGVTLALALAVTAGLALWSWSNFKSSERDNRRIHELQQKIAAVDDEERQAEAVLNRAENQDVRDQSQFWNDVIDQKSFSWTQLFSDLEKIMPQRAFVVSAQPAIADRKLVLHLVFVGEKHDDALELLSKMERSDRFQAPKLETEDVRPASSAPGSPLIVQFSILTFYTPASVDPQPHTAAAGAASKEGA